MASTSTHSAIVGEAVIAITSPLATSTSRPVINTGRAVYSATRCPAHRLAPASSTVPGRYTNPMLCAESPRMIPPNCPRTDPPA